MRWLSMMQLLVNCIKFDNVYEMKSEMEFLSPLKLFCMERGAPKALMVLAQKKVIMFPAFPIKLELLLMCWKGKLNIPTGLIEILD